MFAIVTGGGTAGHVNPALAIMDALADLGHAPAALHYVGARAGKEAELVPRTGYPATYLPGRGIQRRLTTKNVQAVWGLLQGTVQAVRLVGRLRPRVVVAVGGYASVAVGLAAVLHRVPLVVAEQNVAPGAANRLLARFAKAAAVAFPGTPLPRAEVVGNPIRDDISALDPGRDRAVAKAELRVGPGRRLVLVTGGSLGALSLNRATLAAASLWVDRTDLSIRHVIGRRDWSEMASVVPSEGTALEYQAVEYEHDMAGALAAADVAVCRSGSSTCFELAAAAVPSVLVPSPHVTADQQTGNARRLVEAGAGVLVPDSELDGPRMVAAVDAILSDPYRAATMAAAARSWARPNAAADIAAMAVAHARG